MSDLLIPPLAPRPHPATALLAITLSLLFAARANAQTAAAGLADQVAGRVLSDHDSHPLAHATVTLIFTRSNRIAATAYTVGQGHSRFVPIPPGKYRITASAPGFISASYLPHGQFSTALVTGAGLDTGSIELRPVPTSALFGRVFDESGDPVPHANITLYREALPGPEGTADTGRILRFRNVQSEDDGTYEFLTLPRGRYFLSASAKPWYARSAPIEAEGANPAYRAAVDPALDVAYPTVFYPDALDSSGASALTFHGGEQVTANLQMQPQHALTLTLRPAPGDKLDQRFPLLSRSVFGTPEMLALQSEVRDGTQRITGIPPGRYDVSESIAGNGMPVSTGSIDLFSTSATIDLPQAGGLVRASITVHGAGLEPAPEPLQISLRGSPANRIAGAPVTKGLAEIPNLPPGDYDILVYGGGRTQNLLAVSVSGQPAPDKRLHLASTDPVSVDITLFQGSIQIEGFTTLAGKPSVGAMVELVPAGADASDALYRRDQSDLDGSFVFNNVVPGNYILIAIQDGWRLRFADTVALAPFLMHGVPLSVPAAGLSLVHPPGKILTQQLSP